MIEHYCPNPIVLQRLQAGPFSEYIDIFAQQLSDEGYAVWTAKYAMRLLADLTTWMQSRELTITDLAEKQINVFFQHRYRIRRSHNDDQAIMAKFITTLRTEGVIAESTKVIGNSKHCVIVHAFRQYLVCQRNLASSTIRYYLDTVVLFLSQRFGTQSPTLNCAPRSSPSRPQSSVQGCASAASFTDHSIASKWCVAGRDW